VIARGRKLGNHFKGNAFHQQPAFFRKLCIMPEITP
jgi:hypothetical protein